ncbi:hypothetical protein MNQ98_05300 [Paenibacillus sp. N3/727]|uniref:hypothetical protein n=1 Tax=Paenibacillus sp. N3/727 TaxID=2925845 RepID=UPI001F53A4C5|nr:hypothetical protein [Paenibacillus sp. N3/727]UNK19451.1 hypothetical protein MNQ98_05300 [Paenibacillus sp. N3/727]
MNISFGEVITFGIFLLALLTYIDKRKKPTPKVYRLSGLLSLLDLILEGKSCSRCLYWGAAGGCSLFLFLS